MAYCTQREWVSVKAEWNYVSSTQVNKCSTWLMEQKLDSKGRTHTGFWGNMALFTA